MSNRKSNDELLAKVLEAHGSPMGELNFLNTVFGFLNRKTKYLQQSNAQSQIDSVVIKHIEKAKQKKKAKKNKNKSKSKKSASVTTTVKADQKDGSIKGEIEKIKEKSSEDTEMSKPSQTGNELETQTAQTMETGIGTGTDTMEIDTIDAKDDSGNEDNDEDSGEKLIGNGGVTDKYVWSQTLDEVEMKIDIPNDKSGKDCIIEFEDNHLKVKLKGENDYIINGDLHDRVDNEECSWMLDKEYGKNGKTLTIMLCKHKGMNWWNRVIVGDPEINTQKIEPANSKLDDLEPDVRQTVERMMFDQRQKMQGNPSSKELEQQQILSKFKSQHPEMDFSNVKFG